MSENSQNRLKVLVVDDVPEMALMLQQLVDGIEGVEIKSAIAHNTLEARIELDRRRPDIVLLDEILPGESSVDFLGELVNRGVPVILVTGVQNPTHAIPKGALVRLEKPTWKSLKALRAEYAGWLKKLRS